MQYSEWVSSPNNATLKPKVQRESDLGSTQLEEFITHLDEIKAGISSYGKTIEEVIAEAEAISKIKSYILPNLSTTPLQEDD